MSAVENWWSNPRRISVVVDNDSWILPFAQHLIDDMNAAGDIAVLARTHNDIQIGDVAFYLGCIKISPPEVLDRNKRNLIVHASDLPKGRGFSPLTWQIIDGINTIPICLIHANKCVDEGAIVYRELIEFKGDELLDELRRHIGAHHITMAMRYLSASQEPQSHEQSGHPSFYRRRRPDDSRIDPNKNIAEQFNLLRTVDNEKYPAFFEYAGNRYILKIEKS